MDSAYPEAQLIFKYFPELSERQREQFSALGPLYREWNARINLVSRKDIENLYERHVLHSLAVAKALTFRPGVSVMDFGTGGGFPGIPLAILLPEVRFHLVDSVGKKIKVVKAIAEAINLGNVTAEQARGEQVSQTFDLIVLRAVSTLREMATWSRGRIRLRHADFAGGMVCFKGGDLTQELVGFEACARVISISDFFAGEFFEAKKLIYLPGQIPG